MCFCTQTDALTHAVTVDTTATMSRAVFLSTRRDASSTHQRVVCGCSCDVRRAGTFQSHCVKLHRRWCVVLRRLYGASVTRVCARLRSQPASCPGRITYILASTSSLLRVARQQEKIQPLARAATSASDYALTRLGGTSCGHGQISYLWYA